MRFILFFALFMGCAFAKTPPLEDMIAQMIVVGFDGTKESDKWVDQIAKDIKRERVGGVVFTEKNIQKSEKANGIFKLYFDKFDKKRFENESFYSPSKNESTNIGEELKSYKQKDDYDTPFSK